jgi:c-di-GMP-binding flagellar brake protein YcgR
VNISGGGMSFSAKENYKPGNILELKMLLPLLPPVALYLYGEVVKTQSQPEGPLIFVKFIAIDEEIRDELVKFVFKRQRDILREKRR